MPIALLVRFETASALPAWIGIVISTQSFFIHSTAKINFGPLRYIVGENRFHRIHHSTEPRHFDKNFGTVTPIYDILRGTAYFPEKGEWPTTGLAETPEPKSIFEYLAMPFAPANKIQTVETNAN
jgi:sterol desaturase/sphingolipid hydroxylase (fatty acid hydroxylase superfamily)